MPTGGAGQISTGSQDGSKWSLGGPGGDKAIERCRPDVERHNGNNIMCYIYIHIYIYIFNIYTHNDVT